MSRVLAPHVLLVALMAADAVAETDAQRLAKDRLDIKNPGLRLLAKAGAGSASACIFAGMAIGAQQALEPEGDPGVETHRTLGHYLVGLFVGCSVGFPFGVSLVDPHDSLPITLLAGLVPGAVGWYRDETRGAIFLMYVAPAISSLIASEASRKPPESSGASFALSPIPAGALCKVTLRF